MQNRNSARKVGTRIRRILLPAALLVAALALPMTR